MGHKLIRCMCNLIASRIVNKSEEIMPGRRYNPFGLLDFNNRS